MKLKRVALVTFAALVGSASLYLAIELAVVACTRLGVIVIEATEGDPPEYIDYTYGSHDYEDFAIVAYWPSGQRRKIPFDLDMLSENDRGKFDILGKHELTVSYKGISTSLKIEVIRYCQITYVIDVGDGNVQSEAYQNGTLVTLPVPTADGLEFRGWYDNPDYSGQPYPSSIVINEDITLYCKWEEIIS